MLSAITVVLPAHREKCLIPVVLTTPSIYLNTATKCVLPLSIVAKQKRKEKKEEKERRKKDER